jgi:hypothetical protein
MPKVKLAKILNNLLAERELRATQGCALQAVSAKGERGVHVHVPRFYGFHHLLVRHIYAAAMPLTYNTHSLYIKVGVLFFLNTTLQWQNVQRAPRLMLVIFRVLVQSMFRINQ